MRDNVQREWSLLELAREVNLSVWRLSHIFASEVGKSPMQYLRQLRLDRAKYLLETSFLSVKEITHQVGLKDDNHFVSDFKKVYGDAPTRSRLSRLTRNDFDEIPELATNTGAVHSSERELTLDVLTNEFDEMLERMQTEESRKGMKAAFNASAEQLGRAAVKGARRNSQANAIPSHPSARKAQAKTAPARRSPK